jgi:hypothetical protein
MRGILFTELLAMVEAQHSLSGVDSLVRQVRSSSGGAYTRVGNYPHEELNALLAALAERNGTSVTQVLRAFGAHLAGAFHSTYPELFAGSPDALTFLAGVGDYVHVEVHKRYPDAQLPRFIAERADDHTLLLTYRSHRGLADLAEGLIHGVARHYGESVLVTRQERSEDASLVLFTIRREPR